MDFVYFVIAIICFLSIIGTIACLIGGVWSNENGTKWFKTAIVFAIVLAVFTIAGFLLIDYNTNYLGGM